MAPLRGHEFRRRAPWIAALEVSTLAIKRDNFRPTQDSAPSERRQLFTTSELKKCFASRDDITVLVCDICDCSPTAQLIKKRAQDSSVSILARLNAVYGPTNHVSVLIPSPTGIGAKIALATTMPSAIQNRTRMKLYP